MSAEVTVLPSGLTVATDAMPGIGTAAVSVAFSAGGRSEAAGEHGLAHFLEHMAFKGTRRRSARAIAEEIEQVGGDLNAATGVEMTTYDARVLAADVPLALDILSDILTEPTLDPEEVARERNVILQEIGACEDTPDDLVYDLAQEAAFAGQALGRPILGTEDSLNALGRDAFAAFRARRYSAPATVVAAAGAVRHEEVVALAERLLAPLPGHVVPAEAPALWTGGDRRAVRDLEQAHVVLAWPGRALPARECLALQLFAHVAGGGMSSRLFQEVREKRGLAYAVQAFHWGFSDTGVLGVYAGTGEDDLDELVPVVLGELAAAAETADEREVLRAKAQLRMGLELAREQPAARAERLARQIFVFGRPLPPEEILARLDAVTVDDVRRAGTVALSGVPALAAVGPVGGLWDGARIAARLGGRAPRAA